jgi:hypothetical protein
MKRDIVKALNEVEPELDACVVFDSVENETPPPRRLLAAKRGFEMSPA